MATTLTDTNNRRRLNWQQALLQLAVLGAIWFFSSLPAIVHNALDLYSLSSDWPLRVYPIVQFYLEDHPYLLLSTCSIIFFGPIAFVLPLVILQDVCILMVINAISLFHGFIPVWKVAGHYYSTNSTLNMEFLPDYLRLERIFAELEWLAGGYNAWTTKHKVLLVIRVIAAMMALYIGLETFYFGW